MKNFLNKEDLKKLEKQWHLSFFFLIIKWKYNSKKNTLIIKLVINKGNVNNVKLYNFNVVTVAQIKLTNKNYNVCNVEKY